MTENGSTETTEYYALRPVSYIMHGGEKFVPALGKPINFYLSGTPGTDGTEGEWVADRRMIRMFPQKRAPGYDMRKNVRSADAKAAGRLIFASERPVVFAVITRITIDTRPLSEPEAWGQSE